MAIYYKYIVIIIFSLGGGLGGFLYWKYVGCISGSCPIQSNPLLSTIYGLLLGYVIGEYIKGYIN
ncbi:MAG TPA: hypothetical protein EYQ86_00175 [Bacteroidetes bacterium]|nr:hypothetical protein [Bacteroidota bacterium]